MLPVRKLIRWRALQISFLDPGIRRLFSTRKLIEARYSPELSKKIMLRLAMLRAAKNLASIPVRPPFNLRKSGQFEYAIDLTDHHAIHLRTGRVDGADPKQVEAVVMLGVWARESKKGASR